MTAGITRSRIAAAIAGIATALLLQATLIAPISAPFAISLPAVLVAAVALVDGPATGISMGFAAGMVADLGSQHAAGVLALCWLGVGLICGTLADRHSLVRDAITVGVICGVASSVATLLMVVLREGAATSDAIRGVLPACVGDALLAFLIIPVARRMLGSPSLRNGRPLRAEFAAARRG